MSLSAELQHAFAPFADPATEVAIVETDASKCSFRFFRRGELLAGRARTSTRGTEVEPEGGAWQSLRTFLASPKMAHLDELARVQVRVYERQGISGAWVSGPASLDEGLPQPSVDAFRRGTMATHGKTRVVVLDAPAGMGKTTLCSRIAAERAAAWNARTSDHLLLIVSSKGRRLSRLNDAIAATLQDLRVPVYYPEIPVLVRHGLVTLVIDGFDELVNQDGYDDAWYSLTELLDSLAGAGVLVLSSRDTFFSDQEFVQRAQRRDPVWMGRLDFGFIRLLPWGRPEAAALLDILGVGDAARDDVLTFYGQIGRGPLLRPYFIRQLAGALGGDEEVDADHLLPLIVDGFLVREAKLLFPDEVNGVPILKEFFWELSAEMRSQERDSLDLDVLQFFLDAVLESHGIPDERRRQIVHRAGAVAFLDSTGERGKRSFPHEIIKDYFYAQRLVAAVQDPDTDPSRLLASGSFGLDLAEAVVEVIDGTRGASASTRDAQRLFATASERAPTDPAALNAAAMGFALLRTRNLRREGDLRIAGLHIGGVSLAGATLPNLSIEHSSIGFLDLTDTGAAGLRISDTLVQRLRVSGATRLSAKLSVAPIALEVLGDGGVKTVYDPSVIARELGRLFLDGGRQEEASTEGEQLLDELARRWVRRFYLDPGDLEDEPAFGHAKWPALRAVLEEFDRLEDKTNKPVSGRPRSLLHLRDPKALLDRKHPDAKQQSVIDSIWARARAL